MREALGWSRPLQRLTSVHWCAYVSGAAVLIAAFIVMAQRGAPWRGDLIWTIDWAAVGFVVCGPIIAGVVAFDTGRARASEQSHHVRPGRLHRHGVALSHVIAVTVAQVGVLGIAVLISQPPTLDPFAWLAAAVQVLLLWLFVSFGALVGRFMRPAGAGAVASISVLVVVYLCGSPSRHLNVLNTGLASLPRVGYAYNGAYLASQAGVAAVLIAACWLIQPPAASASRPIALMRCATAVMLSAAVIGAGLVTRSERLVQVAMPPTNCGAIQTLPVCYFPEHRRVDNTISDALWVIVDRTSASPYQGLLPSGFAEGSGTWTPSGGGIAPIWVTEDLLAGGSADIGAIIQGIVEPLHCPQLKRDLVPSEQYGADLQRLVGTWTSLVTGESAAEIGDSGEVLDPGDALTLRDRFASCSYPFTEEG